MASVKIFHTLLAAGDSVSNVMHPGMNLIYTWVDFNASVIGNYMKFFSSLYLRLKVTVILTLPSSLPLLGFDFSQMDPCINETLVHFSSLYLRLKVTVILTLPSSLPLLGFDFSQMDPCINETLVHFTDCKNLFINKTEFKIFRENEISVKIYRVILNDFWGFNNLSYTIHVK